MTCCLAENVKIQYFFKKIFNSHVYHLVDNYTMKIQKEIKYVHSHILSYDLKLTFFSFVTTFAKLQTPQVKYLPELFIVS